MQGTPLRALMLAGIFGVALVLYWAGSGSAQGVGQRWPADESVYGVDGWSVGQLSVEHANGVDYLTRTYSRGAEGRAEEALLTVATSASAKAIYRAGAEVPFLGSGYAVDSVPLGSVPPRPDRAALLVHRGGQAAIVMYAYGERRGLLGNGALAWGYVGLDAILGQTNDYFFVSMLVPYNSAQMPVAPGFVELADTVLPKLASWYAAA